MPTIGDIQQIYAAGFNLEDVKITLDHDLKMDVAGIKIDAREGDDNQHGSLGRPDLRE